MGGYLSDVSRLNLLLHALATHVYSGRCASQRQTEGKWLLGAQLPATLRHMCPAYIASWHLISNMAATCAIGIVNTGQFRALSVQVFTVYALGSLLPRP